MKKYVDTAVWENDYRERLKKLIAENNITARELSLSLGYNEGYISRILKGKIDPSSCRGVANHPRIFGRDADAQKKRRYQTLFGSALSDHR